MSMKPLSGRVEEDVHDRLGRFAEDYGLDDSKAMRRALDEGLRQYGYSDGAKGQYADAVLAELSKALLFVGCGLWIVTVMTPLNWSFKAAMIWLVAALLLLVRQADVDGQLRQVREAIGG
jgi:hypothetical protein